MSAPVVRFGISNMSRFVERTLWTSGAFATANAVTSFLFNAESFSNRLTFSLMHAGFFNYFFETTKVENWNVSLKESFDHPSVHHVIDYAHFMFIALAPVVCAQVLTNWIFQPLSLKDSFKIGTFNYLFGLACIPVYENVFKASET